jgi:Flp pilus assembly protein TadG
MKLRWLVHHLSGRGQAMVEFALVFPVLLLLIFGLIDIGRLVYTHNALSEAAREGARFGSVQARSATDLPGIEAHTINSVVGIGGVDAEATCIRSGTGTGECQQFDTLAVRASVEVGMITPIISQLMSAAGLNPFNLNATAQVVVNN